MRVLLTGATGFNGSHIARGLADDGHEVTALVRQGSDLSGLDPRVHPLAHDGTTEGLYELMRDAVPDAVVHLAFRYVATHAPEDIDSLLDTNLGLGWRLLDAMSRCGVSRLLNFGTSWQHFHTDDYNPVSLYAATKQAFEDIAKYYVDALGVRMLTLKLSDTYGPEDTRGKLVPLLIRASRSGETLSMSPGQQLMNLTHVTDVVAAVRVGLARLETGAVTGAESYAVRGPDTVTLRELVALLERVSGREVKVNWGGRPYRPREPMRPWMGELLPGWAPAIRLEAGLRQLVDFDD